MEEYGQFRDAPPPPRGGGAKKAGVSSLFILLVLLSIGSRFLRRDPFGLFKDQDENQPAVRQQQMQGNSAPTVGSFVDIPEDSYLNLVLIPSARTCESHLQQLFFAKRAADSQQVTIDVECLLVIDRLTEQFAKTNEHEYALSDSAANGELILAAGDETIVIPSDRFFAPPRHRATRLVTLEFSHDDEGSSTITEALHLHAPDSQSHPSDVSYPVDFTSGDWDQFNDGGEVVVRESSVSEQAAMKALRARFEDVLKQKILADSNLVFGTGAAIEIKCHSEIKESGDQQLRITPTSMTFDSMGPLALEATVQITVKRIVEAEGFSPPNSLR